MIQPQNRLKNNPDLMESYWFEFWDLTQKKFLIEKELYLSSHLSLYISILVINGSKYSFSSLYLSFFFQSLGLFLLSFPNFFCYYLIFLFALFALKTTTTHKALSTFWFPPFRPLPFPTALFTLSIVDETGNIYSTEGNS